MRPCQIRVIVNLSLLRLPDVVCTIIDCRAVAPSLTNAKRI
jgi:hypothetical protein